MITDPFSLPSGATVDVHPDAYEDHRLPVTLAMVRLVDAALREVGERVPTYRVLPDPVLDGRLLQVQVESSPALRAALDRTAVLVRQLVEATS